MQYEFDLRFLFSIFLRRFPIFILTAILVFGGAAGVAVLLPPVYKASATMLVISQQIPSGLAQSTVTVSAVERLKVIEKQLMTRDTLLAIEEQFRIFPNRANMSPTTVVEAMRGSTQFEQARLGQDRFGKGGALAFTISFSANTPQVAARVTNEFVTRILERNVQLRTSRAAGTSEFFEQQVAKLEAELTKLELDIVAFKRENAGQLPETLSYRRNRLGLLSQARQLHERERSRLIDQRELLMEAMAADRKRPDQMTPDEKELAELERQRAIARATFSESHPRIRQFDTRINALKQLVEEQRKAAEEGGPAAGPISQMERERMVIDKRIEAVEAEIASLTVEIDKLEASIAETPNIEMALRTLNREYEGLREEFAAARAKLSSAATGEELELKQQAERFEVVEQATLPEQPISPNRPMIMMAGAVAGVGAGLALIILLEMMNKTIRRPAELARIDITPIAIVPYIYTTREMRNRRLIRIFLILGTIVLVGVGSYVVHYHYMPLDLLAEKVLEKAKINDLIDLVRNRLKI